MNLKILPRVIENMILDNVLEHHYFEVHKARFKKTLREVENICRRVIVLNFNGRQYFRVHFTKSFVRNGEMDYKTFLKCYNYFYCSYNRYGELLLRLRRLYNLNHRDTPI